MKEYILVINYVKRKPVALVKSEHGVATVIAGDKSAEKVFNEDRQNNGESHHLAQTVLQ